MICNIHYRNQILLYEKYKKMEIPGMSILIFPAILKQTTSDMPARNSAWKKENVQPNIVSFFIDRIL
jgi:hypothetical protein